MTKRFAAPLPLVLGATRSEREIKRERERHVTSITNGYEPYDGSRSYFEGGLDEGQIVIHRGTGAVVFSDASGFTMLTERLATKSNGAPDSLQG